MVLFLDARHPDMTSKPRRTTEAAFHGGIVWIRFCPLRPPNDGLNDVLRQSIERHPISGGVTGEAQRFHGR